MPKTSIPISHLRLKRAYEPAHPQDGVRILVDRLWPRGLSKKTASLDEWEKDVAPSSELRKWFDHDPARWAKFQKLYRAELREHAEALRRIRELATDKTITLVYGARDEKYNNAVVLKQVLLESRDD